MDLISKKIVRASAVTGNILSAHRRKLVKANDAVTRKYSKHMKQKIWSFRKRKIKTETK